MVETASALERIMLYHGAFPGRGVAWANTQIMVVPPGWTLDENGVNKTTTTWSLFWYPDDTIDNPPLERIDFYKVRDLFDFIYLSYEVVVSLEHSPDIPNRPKDPTTLPGWIDYNDIWVDKSFHEAKETDLENPYLVEFAKFKRKNTSAAKYARSEKGKLTQKVYRQSTTGKETAQIRRSEKSQERAEFRIIRDWLKTNPDKSMEDFPVNLLGD